MSGVAGLFVINWKLAIFVLLAVPIKFCLITFFSNKREQTHECILKYYSDFSGWFDDTLNGIAEIKLWNLFKIKKKELIKYQKYNLKFLKEGNLLNSFNLAGDYFVAMDYHWIPLWRRRLFCLYQRNDRR